MTDLEIQQFLKNNGHPEHIWKGGRKGLIDRFEKFVDQVEAGYSLTLDDYRNDLDLRALISRVGLQDEVAELDARFRKRLVFSEQAIWESEDNRDAFWLFGYPRNATGDLRDDLSAEGIVA